MTRASFHWALNFASSGTEPSSRLDDQKCIFSLLHSLVFFGIVVYFLPGGWTSAQNQDAQ
jgi:hypothetical protein